MSEDARIFKVLTLNMFLNFKFVSNVFENTK